VRQSCRHRRQGSQPPSPTPAIPSESSPAGGTDLVNRTRRTARAPIYASICPPKEKPQQGSQGLETDLDRNGGPAARFTAAISMPKSLRLAISGQSFVPAGPGDAGVSRADRHVGRKTYQRPATALTRPKTHFARIAPERPIKGQAAALQARGGRAT
jgi:hypothetical protein